MMDIDGMTGPAEPAPGVDPDADQGRTGTATWAVKNFATADRFAAIEAARRAKLPMAEWLAAAIRRQVAWEREQEERSRAVVPVPDPAAGAVSLDDIGDAIGLAERMARLTGRPPPSTLPAVAYALLCARLSAGGVSVEPAPVCGMTGPAGRALAGLLCAHARRAG